MRLDACVMACLWLLPAAMAAAQQPPITGQMLDTRAPVDAAATPPAPVRALAQVAVPAATPAAEATYKEVWHERAIGDTTRSLFQMQASGAHAGRALPMLGDQAARSHARYLRSFEHPIPEFFDTSVREEVGGSGN